MIKKLRTLYEKDYAPFFALAAAMLLLHLLVPGLMKDDRYYWNVLNEQDTISYLTENWNNWTSRIFIEGVAIWVEHLPMAVWKLLDTGVYTVLGVTISALFFRENRRTLNGWLVCLMLAYPFTDMSTAGWMTTTITYLWPLAAGLGACLYYVKILENRPVGWYEYPGYVLMALYAGSLEQMSAVMTAVTAVLAGYLIWQRKGKAFGVVLFLISLVNLAAALFCPGNQIRTGTEIKQAFRDYRMLSGMDKLQLGYSGTLKEVFFSPELLYLILFLVTAFTVFVRTKKTPAQGGGSEETCICGRPDENALAQGDGSEENRIYECPDGHRFYRAASMLPLSCAVIFGPLRGILSDMLPGLEAMEAQFGVYGLIELGNFDWKRSYVPVILLGAACVGLLVAVYSLYGSSARGWFLMFLLLLGFGTRMVMGFSPTVWKSSSRTYLFLLFAVLIVSTVILHDFYERYTACQRETVGWLLGIGGAAVFISGLMLMH